MFQKFLFYKKNVAHYIFIHSKKIEMGMRYGKTSLKEIAFLIYTK